MSDQSWVALQVAEQLRAAELLVLTARAATAGLDVEAVREETVLITADDLAELNVAIDALSELCGQLVDLTERLSDRDLTISQDDLASAAANDLSKGIMDPKRALLAARVVPISMGWPALASALRSTDTHTSWDDVTVGELLTIFCDAGAALSADVLATAEMSASQQFSCCDPDSLRRLAAALEEYRPAS